MDKQKTVLLASEKQLAAIKAFFNDTTEDLLYGGGARGGKSEVIGIILAICIAAFPGSAWLLSRTQLADLKATTLATFFKVIKRFGYGDKSYRDKIRDERHIEFNNGSRLFVIQSNFEPSDPEFDRLGSYGYTGCLLDEAQQMSNKVREVLQGRLSELDNSFQTEVPMEYIDYTEEQLQTGYSIEFKIVGETVKEFSDIRTSKEDIKEVVIDNGRHCVIIDYYTLEIPYKFIKKEIIDGKLIHTYSWSFKGIILSSCNPGTNFTKTEFYNPWKAKKLPFYMDFIPSLVKDNPWIDVKYIERLERLPEDSVRKQRLLYGNFDYDDNPAILYDQNTINGMFTRKPSETDDDTMYITVDAARQGKDGTEIGLWEGLHLFELIVIEKADLVTQFDRIRGLQHKYNIPRENVVVDEIGVGGGLVDMLGCRGFIGNSQALQPYSAKYLPYKKRNYINLRTQAFYTLQKYMSKISISTSKDNQELITEELLTVKEKNIDGDGKMQIIPKSQMKEELGRSPDKTDCFIAGTKIQTINGEISIEDIKIGDYVITPFGVRKVIKTHNRYEKNELFIMNNKLIGTANHKIYTNKGFKTLDNITMRDNIEVFNLINLLKWRLKRLFYIMERNIGFRQQIGTITGTNLSDEKDLREHYIGTYGKNTTEKYHNDTTYTILTEIVTTIVLRIWNVLKPKHILKNIGKKIWRILNSIKNVLKHGIKIGIKHHNGINQKNEENGIEKIVNYKNYQGLQKNVKIVEKNMKIEELSLDTVLIAVCKNIITKLKNITNKENVLSVEKISVSEKVKKQNAVQLVVPDFIEVEGKKGAKVYDLEIEGDNCYYANNILVSNCISMRTYWIIKYQHINYVEEDKEEELPQKKDKLFDYIISFDNKKTEGFDLDIY